MRRAFAAPLHRCSHLDISRLAPYALPVHTSSFTRLINRWITASAMRSGQGANAEGDEVIRCVQEGGLGRRRM